MTNLRLKSTSSSSPLPAVPPSGFRIWAPSTICILSEFNMDREADNKLLRVTRNLGKMVDFGQSKRRKMRQASVKLERLSNVETQLG